MAGYENEVYRVLPLKQILKQIVKQQKKKNYSYKLKFSAGLFLTCEALIHSNI
jgi:hypothetical protein